MKIYTVDQGFCKSVENAVNVCLSYKDTGAYTYGNLIHNKLAVDELKKNGIIPVLDIASLKEGDTVIIPCHGAKKTVIDQMRQKKLNVIDLTCPFIKKTASIIQEYSKNGYYIIILGKAGHTEVEALKSLVERCDIVSKIEEIDLTKSDKFCVVAQTTFSAQEYRKIEEYLGNINKNCEKTVELFNTICYTTTERQRKAEELSQKADTVFVIGDTTSNNANELLNIAKKYTDAYLIENLEDLKPINKKNIAKLGIISSASALKKLTMEVIISMEERTINSVEEVTEVPATEVAKETKIAKPAKKEEPVSMKDVMAQIDRSFRPLKEGSKLKATVISADQSGITVSINLGKNDSGFIDRDEAALDGNFNPDDYKAGDVLDVVVIPKKNDKLKCVNLSKKDYDAIKLEDEKVTELLNGNAYTVNITKVEDNKKGLISKIGTYTIFIPASQILSGFVKAEDLEKYKGKDMIVKAIPPKESDSDRKPNPKRIVASHRVVIEEEKNAKMDAFWSKIFEGAIVSGKVKRFTDFGAFVNVDGFDCLAHISDLSWNKINSPAEVLELDKTYDFMVIKFDRAANKVSLGYRQLQKKPYEYAAEKYPVGTVITGTVERIHSYGVFVSIEKGIDGLVHVSQISNNYIQNAAEVFNVGDPVTAVVTNFDGNKITLSIKALLPPEEVKEEVKEEVEEKPKRARARKTIENFESAKPERKERKPRSDRNAESDEPHEYISSSSSGTTLGDMFKGFDLNKFSDGEDK